MDENIKAMSSRIVILIDSGINRYLVRLQSAWIVKEPSRCNCIVIAIGNKVNRGP